MKLYLALIFATFLPVLIIAQENGNDQGGFDQTQIITGDRTLKVQKAFKISDMPKLLEISVPENEFEYALIPKRPARQIDLEPIPPAKVKVRKPLEKLYKGFVKGGVGTFATPYLDAYYASIRDRDLAWVARLRHLSSNDVINREVAFSGFSENISEAWV